MKTVCERCTEEIDDTEVNKCDKCGRDGLCNDCLTDHNCVANHHKGPPPVEVNSLDDVILGILQQDFKTGDYVYARIIREIVEKRDVKGVFGNTWAIGYALSRLSKRGAIKHIPSIDVSHIKVKSYIYQVV